MPGSEARLGGSWLLPSHHGRSGTPVSIPGRSSGLRSWPSQRLLTPFISSPCGSQDDNDYGHDNEFRDRGGIHAGVHRGGRARLDKLARNRCNDWPLYTQYVAATIDKLADDDAVLIFNVGTPSVWAAHLS